MSFNLGAVVIDGGHDLSFGPEGWIGVLAIAVVCTTVAVSTFFAGMRRVGPSNASILSTLEPPVTVLLAFLVFDETLSALQLAGGALVLAAVVVLQVGGRTVEPAPDAVGARGLSAREPTRAG